MDVPSNTESEEEKYESTGQEFDRDLLSPRASEMCKDSKVVWMAKTNGKYLTLSHQISNYIQQHNNSNTNTHHHNDELMIKLISK